MQKVNREDFLSELQEVSVGLSRKENVDQSTCFAFKKGYLCTYNGEIACRRKSSVQLNGTVIAIPLISLLQKIPDEILEIEQTDKELRIRGEKKRLGIAMDPTILMPINEIERPKEWSPLEESFSTALMMAAECVGHNESEFELTCVHVNPSCLEASDNYQIIRYKINSPVRESFLLRGPCAKYIATLEASSISEGTNWVHFKSGDLIISVKRYVEPYPNIEPYLKFKGREIVFPKSLSVAAERAAISAAENSDLDLIEVEIQPNRLRVKGQGIHSWYQESKKIRYQGPPLTFMISPKLLSKIAKDSTGTQITEDRLRIKGSLYTFVTCLSAVE